MADHQGALLIFMRASGGDPSPRQPEFNQWLWTELLTSSPDSAVSFYKDLAGYEEETAEHTEGFLYHVLMKQQKPTAGVVKNPFTLLFPAERKSYRKDHIEPDSGNEVL